MCSQVDDDVHLGVTRGGGLEAGQPQVTERPDRVSHSRQLDRSQPLGLTVFRPHLVSVPQGGQRLAQIRDGHRLREAEAEVPQKAEEFVIPAGVGAGSSITAVSKPTNPSILTLAVTVARVSWANWRAFSTAWSLV